MEVSITVGPFLDWVVARRLLKHCGHRVGYEGVLGSTEDLDGQLHALNVAAQRVPWLVLRGLAGDAPCAPSLVAQKLCQPAPQMCFRVAQQAVEAWLLGDAENLAGFLQVAPGRITAWPETLPDPRAAVVDLARRSRSRRIRQAMVPPRGAVVRVGPDYLDYLCSFASRDWRPGIAARHCPSLERCLAALRRWPR